MCIRDRDWRDVDENIKEERKIKLRKVYRNTKNILSFIQSLGFPIEILKELKEGPQVVEKIINTKEEEIEHIRQIIPKYKEGSIGILAKEEIYLDKFRSEFKEMKNIHVLSMIEAQGVEFDVVFIVGVDRKPFEVSHHVDVLPEHIEERKRMQKDLLYVALTRAITELHILGKERLEDVLKS